MKEVFERLGLSTTLEEEQEKFIFRMNKTTEAMSSWSYIDANEYEIRYSIEYSLGFETDYVLSFIFTDRNFTESLIIIESMIEAMKIIAARDGEDELEQARLYFISEVNRALDLSVVDLGIELRDGKFFRKGAEELDESLLVTTLQWLSKYKKPRELFESALQEYLKKDYPDCITKCFSAFESLVKTILETDKTLENSKDDLLARLKLPTQWKGILTHYCIYAHEFASRHGKREKGEKVAKAEQKEVEAYLYLTGLLMRLTIQSI